MERLRWVVADADLIKAIVLCAIFIGLNILDAWLTGFAVAAGHYELNPFLGMRLGSNMLIKGLLSAGMVTTLVVFKRGGLLKPLSLGMLLICVWNGFILWYWS